MKLAQKLALGYYRARLRVLAVISPRRAAALAFDLFCTPFRRSDGSEPPVFKKATRLPLRVDGLEVAGYCWNRGQRKRILIVHGFESSALNFAFYINALVESGFEVIGVDAPAHGASAGRQITLPLYVRCIEALVAVTGPPAAAMAHSFGGLALMHYLETAPVANTCRTALLAPATETLSAVKSLFRLLHLSEALRPAFDEVSRQRGYKPYDYYSIRRILTNIHPPVLWVHDEEDEITPLADVRPLIAEAPANIEFMLTRGWGHRRIYREAEVQQKVISFLTAFPVAAAEHGHE